MSNFQGRAGLFCKAGCGECCKKADIEATTLEFLPFAQHVYESGCANDWLERLRIHTSTTCLFLKAHKEGMDTGLCSQYVYRGLICRLFGFSARTNKYGKRELVSCRIIKTEQSKQFEVAAEEVMEGGLVPVMNHYYMQLFAIDPDLGRDFYPINEAIKRAIEYVLHCHAYGEPHD